MAVVQVAPRKRDTPAMTLRRGGIIYLNAAAVKLMPLPMHMRVEMDAESGGIWLRPDPNGRILSRWTGKSGGYLQLRNIDTPIVFDGTRIPAQVGRDGTISATLERACDAG